MLFTMMLASIVIVQAQRWSEEKVNRWYKNQTWQRGCNFIPSNAINQLEMWQEETFSPRLIDKELSWAKELGFNCMRVYLHHVAWEIDSKGFKERVEKYLEIADKYGIKTIFVFFDDCWNATYKTGIQPEPVMGKHNSGWLRDPGDLLFEDPNSISVLEEYVTDILKTFKKDERILVWDLYNEPGNSKYNVCSLPLLRSVFAWARKVNPSQPLTSGLWNKGLNKSLTQFQLKNSDVISYHNYSNVKNHQRAIDSLQTYNRPLFCTEYMARKFESTFQNIMPLLKNNKVAAINWGLVSGKTNTIYPWKNKQDNEQEPELWFHDILRQNKSPFSKEEVDFIKDITNGDNE